MPLARLIPLRVLTPSTTGPTQNLAVRGVNLELDETLQIRDYEVSENPHKCLPRFGSAIH
jgi:hypothetical protein